MLYTMLTINRTGRERVAELDRYQVHLRPKMLHVHTWLFDARRAISQ